MPVITSAVRNDATILLLPGVFELDLVPIKMAAKNGTEKAYKIPPRPNELFAELGPVVAIVTVELISLLSGRVIDAGEKLHVGAGVPDP